MAITVTANTPATAAAFNNLVPTAYFQGSDQALSTTTFTAHNTFTAIPIVVGQYWEVEVHLANKAADVGNDIKVRWSATGGVALGTYRHILSPGVTATSSADVAGNFQARALTDSVSGGSTTSATVFSSWTERFVVTAVGSNGNLGLEWAQAAAISGSTTVLAGSFLIMRRLI